jgi:SH3-like domain-containing protein
VISKSTDDLVPLHNAAEASSRVVAQLQPGVVGSVKRCDGKWCHFAGAGFDGWIAQERLWGVYPEEKVE